PCRRARSAFFFSSRRRHTRFSRDWSSDVCSSDLGLVCAYPAETVAIYRLVKAGRLAEALEIYRWFMPLLELDITPQLVQNIKLAEVATGIGSEHVRAPRLPLEGAERARVLGVIEKAMKSRPVLPEYKNLKNLV